MSNGRQPPRDGEYPSKGVFCGAVLQFTGCFQYTYHSNPAQTTTFYVPAQQYWTFHYPMTITVQKVGGTNPFTQSQSIDAVSQNSITIGAPNDPDENVTINQLGFNAGGLSQVSVGTPIFFNGGSVCGASNLCGFAGDAQSQIQNYAQYWYGSETTWPSLGYNICNCSTPGQNLGNTQDNPIQTYYPGHPGWKDIETYNNGQTQYTYQPIAPSLTTNSPGLTSNLIYNGYSGSGGIGYGDSEKNSTQAGLSFLNWMYAQVPKEIGGTVDPSLTAYSNPYGNSNPWSVSTQQLTIDLSGSGSLLSSVIIPQTQLLVSTSLADTVVNQVNSAPFTITQIASTTSTLGGGQITDIGVTVQNTGSYAGSATLSFSQISDLVSLSPPSATFTLNSGASQTFNFAATGLFTTTPNLDKLTFFVMNSAGLVTDSKAFTLTVEPPPLAGTTDFKIENVSLPKSVAVGAQVSMTVDIQSIGIAGVAYITATSSANQIVSVNPTHVNQSMGSGNTVPVGFTVVGVALPSGVTQQSVTIDVQVSNGSSISESMVSILVTSTGGAPCIINCNNNNSSGPAPTEIIAICTRSRGCGRSESSR